jgi:hypothetical protein
VCRPVLLGTQVEILMLSPPWYCTHGMVMFWWRHVLLRPLWSHNVGLGSLLSGVYGRSLCFAGLLDGVLVDHLASQTCSLERGL